MLVLYCKSLDFDVVYRTVYRTVSSVFCLQFDKSKTPQKKKSSFIHSFIWNSWELMNLLFQVALDVSKCMVTLNGEVTSLFPFRFSSMFNRQPSMYRRYQYGQDRNDLNLNLVNLKLFWLPHKPGVLLLRQEVETMPGAAGANRTQGRTLCLTYTVKVKHWGAGSHFWPYFTAWGSL